MTERKPPERHPSSAIPSSTVSEIAYRVYLLRLEPPMTPEESAASDYVDARGRKYNDAKRRVNSEGYEPLTRTFLRVLVDMGIVTP